MGLNFSVQLSETKLKVLKLLGNSYIVLQTFALLCIVFQMQACLDLCNGYDSGENCV